MATAAHRRYAEILRDVEELINDHSSSLLDAFRLRKLNYFKSSIRKMVLKKDRN